MRKMIATFIFVLVLGFAIGSSAVLAGEHGGSTVQEHGGTAVEGSHSHGATLREAAAILKATHPDLAAKLEAIAAEEK